MYYAPQGRQRYAFTPVQETFQHVQDNHWDEVEITLKELDGSPVQFQSDSQCVLQLHFTKHLDTVSLRKSMFYSIKKALQFEFCLCLHDLLHHVFCHGFLTG